MSHPNDLPGSPGIGHADWATEMLSICEDSYSEHGDHRPDREQLLIELAIVQAHAQLAIAAEAQTANLIALAAHARIRENWPVANAAYTAAVNRLGVQL